MITPAGLVPFTTIDFPNYLAAVIFFQGCPLRCPFCHNPNLQSVELSEPSMSWAEILAFLEQRKKRLDGVVLSGGEPLMQPEITSIIQTIKSMGFRVAIHTSGVYTKQFQNILPLLDWVGFDVKAPAAKYDVLTGRKGLYSVVWESLKELVHSGVAYEVRTTLDPRYLTIEDVYQLSQELQTAGVQTYTLQKYRTFDADKNPPSAQAVHSFFEDENLLSVLKSRFSSFRYR